eukprot:269292-Pelagomonas_calceolata.AAC.5
MFPGIGDGQAISLNVACTVFSYGRKVVNLKAVCHCTDIISGSGQATQHPPAKSSRGRRVERKGKSTPAKRPRAFRKVS